MRNGHLSINFTQIISFNGNVIHEPMGDVVYTTNGIVHRIDGPAVINQNGVKAWFLNGELIRVDLSEWTEWLENDHFYMPYLQDTLNEPLVEI